jgi:hypothetical protein
MRILDAHNPQQRRTTSARLRVSDAMRKIKRWSSVVGVAAALCAAPILVEAVERYRQHGSASVSQVAELLTVPLFYIIVRYAERQV